MIILVPGSRLHQVRIAVKILSTAVCYLRYIRKSFVSRSNIHICSSLRAPYGQIREILRIFYIQRLLTSLQGTYRYRKHKYH
ncbi:hypothetical protein D3C80_1068840 [compost metagenome]